MADFQNGEIKAHVLGTKPTFESALTGNYTISTTGGEKIECKAVFQLLGEAVSGFRPSQAEKLTDIPEEKIREATRIIATIRPSCWYTWLGIEQTTNRIEIYSTTFREHGYEPLPAWKEPDIFRREGVAENYPINLINSKVLEYCHSQHRAIPSLRKKVPHPYLEISVKKASELGIKGGDWVMV